MRSLWGWVIGLVIIVAIIIGIVAATGNNNSNKNKTTSNPPPTSQSQSSSNQKAAAEVSMQNTLFTPSQVTINKGETVTWTNNDNMAHTVTSDTGSELNSETLEPGEKYSHTFNTTGSFQYHCTIHPSMRATVVVR